MPAGPQAHDAYLITGSAHSVYEPLAWIDRLKAFVRVAAETRPVVGICFGHQLIAETFGGHVAKAAQGWGVGVHRYRIDERTAWMAPGLDEVALVVSHQDQVVEPPAGARVLGGSGFCPIGIMQIGVNVMSIQSHPEMRPDFTRDLYATRRSLIGAENIDRAISSLDEPTNADAVAQWILAFIDRSPRAETRSDIG